MENDELLFEEYKLCQESTQKLESTIWQTSGVIGIGSIGSFIYLAVRQTKNVNTPLVFAAGSVIVLTVWIWWNIALRWWDIQHAIFLRMGDIEENLKYIFQKRYVNFMDGTRDVFSIDPEYLGFGDSEHGEARKGQLGKNPKFARRGVQGSLKWFPLLITSAWLLYGDFVALSEKLPATFKFLVAIVVLAIFGAWGLCMEPHRKPDFWTWLKKYRKPILWIGCIKVGLSAACVVVGWLSPAVSLTFKSWLDILLVVKFAILFFVGIFLLSAGISFSKKR